MRQFTRLLPVTALTVLLSSCLPMGGSHTLTQLGLVEPPPLQVVAPSEKIVSAKVNYCSTVTVKKNIRTRILYIIDRSGSNLYGPNVGDPGTDKDGMRRFGSVGGGGLLGLDTKLTDDQKNLFEFGIEYFSDRVYGYPEAEMDRVRFNAPSSNSSFVGWNALKTIVEREKPVYLGGESQDPSRTIDKGATDYARALAKATEMIRLSEASRIVPAGEENEIFYMVVFLSDGAPSIPDSGAVGGSSYQPYAQIMAEVDKLTAIQYDSPGVLGVMLHTAFYTQAGVGSTAIPICAGQALCTPDKLLGEMAKRGGGDFVRVVDGESIDFSKFTVPAQLMRYHPLEVFLENTNVLWEGGRLKADRDHDGLSDEFEILNGFDPEKADSRIDGIMDSVVSLRCPTNSQTCVNTCASIAAADRYTDADSDGLNRCEEILIGSNPDRGDSISRGVPDRLSFLRGLGRTTGSGSPATDSDFDGLDNLTEVRLSTPVYFQNSAVSNLRPYRYTVSKVSETADSECFQATVSDITLLDERDVLQAYLVEESSLFNAPRIIRLARKAASELPLVINIGGSP